MLKRRSVQMGCRLAKFEEHGGIGANGALNWKAAGSYALKFKESGFWRQ